MLMKKRNENAPFANTAQMLELASSIIKNLPKDMPENVAQGWIINPPGLAAVLRDVLIPAPPDESDQDILGEARYSQALAEWYAFYTDVFGLDLQREFLDMKMPNYRPGFERSIVIPKGLTMDAVYAKCAQLFPSWKYIDGSLDEAVPTNDRNSNNGSYAIWIRDRVEADEELKNKSANDLKAANVPGITLLERLVLELKYFKETGKHLDLQNVTACTGSRSSGGGVPSVSWVSDGLGVGWSDADAQFPFLRSREVVS